MAYEKKTWEIKTFQKGDTELVEGLNHIEEGIAASSGQSVIANPPISGTETKLNGLKVNDLTYRIVGTQLYRHHFEVPNMLSTSFDIINAESAPYTDLTEQDIIVDGKFCTPGRFQKIVGITYTPDGHKLVLLDYSTQSLGPVMQIASIVELTGLNDTVIEL